MALQRNQGQEDLIRFIQQRRGHHRLTSTVNIGHHRHSQTLFGWNRSLLRITATDDNGVITASLRNRCSVAVSVLTSISRP
ncbi:MAG: hypothetical protein AAF639_36695 [Chloroflexota bacterium]